MTTSRAQKAEEEWRREYPELDSGVMGVVGKLLEASQLIEREKLTPFAERFGLCKGEFDVIASLRRAGAPFELTPTALYEALMLTSGAMTNRLDRLEKAGLIERRPSHEDRRSILVRLTRQGITLIEEMLPLHVQNEQQALAALSPEEQKQLGRLLNTLILSL